MLFTEPAFLFLFLPVLLVVYQLIPARLRNLLLACSSLLFYAVGEKQYAVLMVVSISINYLAGLGVRPENGPRARKAFLVAGIVANLSLLAFFKYAGFVVRNLSSVLVAAGLPAIQIGQIHLPIGISFFTFQALSYVIDVYRGDTRAERNPLTVGLYISLFSQLIAGPIVRFRDIADQIRERYRSARMFDSGVRRFVLGFAKKMILANTFAYPADEIFALPAAELTTGVAWLGVVCYTLQIYFDFSGYSDMAIGLGRMFGFRFLENFRYPYISRSVTELWRRWHISLSRWFRDYLYIPLGGNRAGPYRTYVNLVTVFFLCGLWHGANWLFVVWGLYHGFFLVVERVGLHRILKRLPWMVCNAYSLFTVMMSWVVFRVATGPPDRSDLVGHALEYYRRLFGFGGSPDAVHGIREFLDPYLASMLLVGAVASTPVFGAIRVRTALWLRRRDGYLESPYRKLLAVAGCVWLLLLFVYGAMLMAGDTYNPFIYFQF